MRIPAGLSRILTEIAPERINDGTEQILDVLFKINTVLREINSIDFCNPLGYILTKAMPPGGALEGKPLKFGTSITKFVNDIENKYPLSTLDSLILAIGSKLANSSDSIFCFLIASCSSSYSFL